MSFWIFVVAMTLAVTAALVLPMLRARPGQPGEDAGLSVYRDQLKEVERDAARGLLAPEEAERVRLEIGRRLLEADRVAQATAAPPAPRRGARVAGLLAGAAVAVGAIALYATIGAPSYPDLPLEARLAAVDAARRARPDQAAAEAELAGRLPPAPPVNADPEFVTLMERLREAVAERPEDLRGQELLARNEAALGDFVAARAAQERVLALKGDAATADDRLAFVEVAVRAAQGYVSPEAEQAIAQVLAAEPQNGPARYYAGLLHAQTGRPDIAFRYWAPLLAESAPDDPWVPALRAELPAIAAEAGVRYELPPGPDAADLAAAADLSPEERDAMIRGMVEGLAARLGTSGGPASDWARLITALGVLGEQDRARDVAAEARVAFAGDPDALAAIEGAIEGAGLTP